MKRWCKIGVPPANILMIDPPSSAHTRPSLLLRVRDARDTEAWQSFVDTYAPLVYRYARRRGLQDADAADLAQEVLLETARCLRSFVYQPERGRFRDWLGALTHRKLARFWARRKREAALTSEEPVEEVCDQSAAPPPDAEWTEAFNAQVLQAALERVRPCFEPPTWRAFAGVWLNSRPAPEVADELNVPIEAVYLAKSRVLKRLREEVVLLAEDLAPLVPLS
jgi:RNA polymerase sigma factor (sigma-70 family)